MYRLQGRDVRGGRYQVLLSDGRYVEGNCRKSGPYTSSDFVSFCTNLKTRGLQAYLWNSVENTDKIKPRFRIFCSDNQETAHSQGTRLDAMQC